MLATLAIQILLAGLALGDVSEKLRAGLLPSSSNYQGLETPLEVAAAAPSQKTLRPNRGQNEDNLERLCNDPFHSFLCKPVAVRRRRINGRLRPGAVIPSGASIPSGIVPEASNLQESAQPLESSSDLVRQGKSYLPPIEAKAPKKLIEPQYLPPGFRSPEPSNERTQESKISYNAVPRNRNGLRPAETEKPLKKIEESQIYGQKLKIGTDDAVKNSKQIQPNNLPRKYLPLDETVSPESSNLSPSIQNLPLQGLAAQNIQRKDESHSLERLCNDPFHSFLCKPGKRRKRIDGRLRPEAKIPPNILVASSSIARESRVLPLQERSAGQPSNSRGARDNYLPPNPDKQPTYQNQQTYIPPQDSFGYNYPKPTNNGTLASNNGYIYEKPSNSLPTSQQTYPAITTGSSSQISNTYPTSPQADISQDIVPPSTGYQYVPPGNGLTTSPSLTTQTIPPNVDGTSSQKKTNSGEKDGYYYPKPSSTASTTVKVIQTGPYSTLPPQENTEKPSGTVGGYNYPKPSNPLALASTTFLTTTTPRPDETPTKIPSYQPPDAQTIAVPTSGGYTYPKPSNDKQKSGYNYEKPSVGFTLPAAATNPAANTLITQTTPPPVSITTESAGTTFGYQYPKPSNTQENIVSPNQTGYAYPKPSYGLPYPTTKRPEGAQATSFQPSIVTTQPPLSITTNQNPQPTINQDIAVPTAQSGYKYPKPSVGLTYPSQQTVPITTQTAITTTIKPELETSSIQNIPQASQTGYIYEKPSNSLTLPPKKPLISSTPSSAPTNINQNIVPPTQGGYVYEKPTYSTTLKPASTQTVPTFITTTSNLQTTVQTADNYQYPKPTKKPFQEGYQYPKPAKPFPQPTIKPSTLETTPTYLKNPTTQQTTTAGYQYPKPSNGQVAESPSQNGYVYKKPEISFTLPNSGSASSTVQPIRTTTTGATTPFITTKLTTGYEYPNPSNVQNDVLTPPKQTGYTYPKPSSSVTYPNTLSTVASYPTVAITTNFPTTTKSTTLQSQYTDKEQKEQTGYNYQKPPLPFTYPRPTMSTTTYTRPLNSFQYPKPSFQQNQGSATQNGYVYQAPTQQAAEEGYQYRKPNNPLTLPPRQRSARNYRGSPQYPTRRDLNGFIL